MLRTHLAGELRKELAGETVTLTGWVSRRRDHGGVIFIDLRDRSGIAQVVFRESDVAERAHDLRSEYCVKVTGTVEPRPEGSENPNLPSGEIEVNVADLEVLNKSAALPFQIDDPSTSGGKGLWSETLSCIKRHSRKVVVVVVVGSGQWVVGSG